MKNGEPETIEEASILIALLRTRVAELNRLLLRDEAAQKGESMLSEKVHWTLKDEAVALETRVAELEALLGRAYLPPDGRSWTELPNGTRIKELEAKLAICRNSLDHPVKCPRCEAHFLPYIDPKELRGITPDQLRAALKPFPISSMPLTTGM